MPSNRSSARLDLAGIDFDDFRRNPLDEDTLRCLRYMHDVERHTICYLRDVLVTSAHREPDLTTFMTFWVYQEHWHGEAIGQVLEAHDEPGSDARVSFVRERLGLLDRLMPLGTMVASALTPHVPTVHMTWGAVNEWTTQAAYTRLARRSGHPVLSELVGRIARQEGLHIAFYADQARRRLADSAVARRLTRFSLRHLWTPVGAGLMPESEVQHVARHLFSGPDGSATVSRVDRRVQDLPGLAGLDLLGSAARRLGASVA